MINPFKFLELVLLGLTVTALDFGEFTYGNYNPLGSPFDDFRSWSTAIAEPAREEFVDFYSSYYSHVQELNVDYAYNENNVGPAWSSAYRSYQDAITSELRNPEFTSHYNELVTKGGLPSSYLLPVATADVGSTTASDLPLTDSSSFSTSIISSSSTIVVSSASSSSITSSSSPTASSSSVSVTSESFLSISSSSVTSISSEVSLPSSSSILSDTDESSTLSEADSSSETTPASSSTSPESNPSVSAQENAACADAYYYGIEYTLMGIIAVVLA